MKYHLVTLGCQMNMSDSERVRSVIEGMGYQWTDKEEDANMIGILACSVRQKAIDKVYSKIHKWNQWKNRKHLLTYISGCLLPSDKEKFLKTFDIVFNMRELPELPKMVEQYGIANPMVQRAPLHVQTLDMSNFWHVAPQYTSHFEAFIPIQNGCDKFCTFCAVPYTRGREVSRPSDEILEEVERLVNEGYKSITLLGQNVNSYGWDKQGQEVGFAELLRRIGELGNKMKKDFWVYFTSPHPRDMTDEVLEVIAQYPCLAKQIHLPVQSGDDKVLMRMNRQHNIGKYRQTMQSIRRILPDATVFTDIIVGFTGETDEQFENTRLIMEEFQYNMAYIAKYSPRPGAASSRWDDDINDEIKKQRYQILSDELRRHTAAYNRRMVGKTYKVLVRGNDRKVGFLTAQTEGKVTVRFASDNADLIGQFVNVKISSAAELSVEGKLVVAAVPELVLA